MKLITFLLFVFSLPAFAGEWTALAGWSKFTAHGDGVWYQQPFPHKLDLTSPSLGLRYDTKGPMGLTYGAGYMHLGKVRTTAQAVALDGKQAGDGGYNPETKACNGPCWPMSTWNGYGDVQGVFGAVGKAYGPWTVEAGLYLYKPKWTMNVPDWIACRECEPQNITVRSIGARVGPMFGVKYKTGRWSVNASAWHTKARGGENGGSYPAIYNNFTYNLSTGFTF